MNSTDKINLIRPELISLSCQQLEALIPYLYILGGALISLVIISIAKSNSKWTVFVISSLACFAASLKSVFLFQQNSVLLFNGTMICDSYAYFFNVLFSITAFFTLFSSLKYLDQEKIQYPEFSVLVLFSVFGMMVMSASLDLIVFFVALELVSLSIYALVCFRRADRRSNEASLKYFILGSIVSAIFLYGVALLYGSTGTTEIRSLLKNSLHIHQHVSLMFSLGFGMVLIGFLFKVGIVPFHMWLPDVYEGAPLPVTGFMAVALKAASFSVFLRFFSIIINSSGEGKTFLCEIQNHVHNILWITCALSMILGNLLALVQSNLKRMLAYSSIAHSGYILIGFIAGIKSEIALTTIVFYIFSYSLMTFGAFVILTLISGKNDFGLNLNDFSGISKREPWLAFAFALFIFSMAGIPPTFGFFSKYFLLYSAVQAGEIPLVVLSVFCSAISIYYYLKVVVYMYMREVQISISIPSPRASLGSQFVLIAIVSLSLGVSFFPKSFFEFAKKAITSM